MPKNNMKDTNYYQSGKQLENVMKARELALLASKAQLENRIQSYNSDPSLCATCSVPLPYKKKSNKFCSNACSATFNNSRRSSRTEESRNKTSVSVKQFYVKHKGSISRPKITKLFCVVSFYPCTICQKLMTFNSSRQLRKTCSRECQIHASVGNRSYINGRRLNIYYFNKHEQITVLLESSWELAIAEWLDAHGIVWIRPKPIPWKDHTSNKTRLYYPDFYLPNFDLYLDPKNPTALAKSSHKMSVVSGLINLKFGSVQSIKDAVINLVRVAGFEPAM